MSLAFWVAVLSEKTPITLIDSGFNTKRLPLFEGETEPQTAYVWGPGRKIRDLSTPSKGFACGEESALVGKLQKDLQRELKKEDSAVVVGEVVADWVGNSVLRTS